MPGGSFKKEVNLVVDRSPDGSTTVRFKPVPAASTPFAVDDLIKRYQEAPLRASTIRWCCCPACSSSAFSSSTLSKTATVE